MRTGLRLALLCLPLLASSAIAQEAASAPTVQTPASDPRIAKLLEAMEKIRAPRSVALSPDGKHLAWNVEREDVGELHLGSADAQSSAGDQLISPTATAAHCKNSAPTWSPDSKTLVFLSTCGAAKQEGRPPQAEVFAYTVADQKVRQLTHVTGALTAPKVSPDGKSVAFLFVENALRAAGAVQPMTPPAGVVGRDQVQVQRVAVVDMASGETKIVTPTDLHVYEFDWAPSSRQLTYVAAPAPGENNWWVAQLYTQAFDAKPVSIVNPQSVSGDLHGLQICVPRWSPDGSTIAFIGGLMSDQGSNGGDIYLISANGGQPRNITPGRKATPAWIEWRDKDHLSFTEHQGGNAHSAVISKTGVISGPEFSLPESIGSGQSALSLSVSEATKQAAFVRQSFERAPEVWVAKLDSAPAYRQISHVNDGLSIPGGKSESIEWKNEGYNVQGWLVYPVNFDASRKYPLIVAVHGGPSAAATPRATGQAKILSEMGYFVLMPNPRGSFGQGEEFTKANRKDFGYGDLRDIIAGLDTLGKRLPIDQSRVGITGFSYGGFMTMFAVTQTNRFHAAVAGAGISNWQSYYGENSIDQWMIPFFGASVYDDPAVYAKSSAITYIKKAKTPMLIFVGDRDGECPMPQSFEMWHALRDQKVPTELVIYPGEGHHFAKEKDVVDSTARMVSWFDQHLSASNSQSATGQQ